MNAEYGEYYIWDGANLKHGNKMNESDISRFSVDFRVLPYSKYDEKNVQETITTKTKLKLGLFCYKKYKNYLIFLKKLLLNKESVKRMIGLILLS